MQPDYFTGSGLAQPVGPGKAHTGVVTLLFTDIVGSTGIKRDLGERASDTVFQNHHQLVRQTLSRFSTGREIETAGDSFRGAPGWEAFATTGDGWLHAWSADTGRLVFSRRVLDRPFVSLGLSPGRRRFWTGELSGTLKVWNLESAEPESTISDLRPGSPYAFATSSGGDLVAFRTISNDALVWDSHARTRRALIRCADIVDRSAIALSPDERFLAVASNDRPAQIWDLATEQPATGLLYGHLAGIERVGFSPDSRLLITYCGDYTAKIWSVATGQEVLSGIPLNDLQMNPFWQLFPDRDTVLESTGANGIRLVHLPTLAQIDARDVVRQKVVIDEQRRRNSIQQWLVLAPFPYPQQQPGRIALDAQQLPNEHELRPRAGETVRVGDDSLVWRIVQTSSGLLDLDGPHHEYCAGYAVCYLHSDRARQGLRMYLGSDDQAKLYLNGRLLFRSDEARTFYFDQNVIEGVSLDSGNNVLVFKIINETTDWRGAIRITDGIGQPVPGLRTSLRPD